ncbi:AAHS family 4-hydroxybenzoate transporter-like MFS transporter [Paraburkholderia sp. RAU6.4a]|uniref:MFS transporter n=1 Tax=Paraburkholderia sp. RAU6.4a TaxID=2991067 RepID=UPI003D258439
MTHRYMDVQDFLDSQKGCRLQWIVVALMFVFCLVDGFDATVIGFVGPSLKSEWKLMASDLALIFGAGMAGLFVGGFCGGPLADRYGRKPVIVAAVAFFGATTFGSVLAANAREMVALRFLTGVGLGAAMPTALTLLAEFAPNSMRARMTAWAGIGFTLGGASAGQIAAYLIPAHGWRSVMVTGVVFPFALCMLLVPLLPESLRYLVVHGGREEKIKKVVERIDPELSLTLTYRGDERPARAIESAGALFSADLRMVTAMIWITYCCSLFLFYLMSSWLPLILNSSGIDMKHAAKVSSAFLLAGAVGMLLLGVAMDRFRGETVLSWAYVLGAVSVSLVGFTADPIVATSLIVCFGLAIGGAQSIIPALVATCYPTSARATGVSWASAIGRVGAFLGSVAGAVMLDLHLSNARIFALLAIPAMGAAIALIALGRIRQMARAILTTQ